MVKNKTKKIICIFLTLLLFTGIAPLNCFAAEPTVWNGTSDISWYAAGPTVFTISTPEQLAGLAYLVDNGNNFSGKTINLGADIVLNSNAQDFSAWGTTPPANAWENIGYYSYSTTKPFSGTFNGNHYTISGIYINNSADMGQGLFAYLDNGTVRNLNISNSYIKGGSYVGGIAGYSYLCTITDCHNSSIVTGTSGVGGIIGFKRGSVTNCSNSGAVGTSGATATVGGIVGFNSIDGLVSSCYNTGSVSGSNTVGGIAGDVYYSIENCYNTGTIYASSYKAGGIAADFESGTLSKCYNTGTVASPSIAGGIIGILRAVAAVSNCYSTGTISLTGDHGGIAGYRYSGGIIANTFYYGCDAGVSGVSAVQDGTTPFIKLAQSSIAIGGTTTIARQSDMSSLTTSLGTNLAVSFSIFSSAVANISGTDVTATAAGNGNVTGSMTITQNDLTETGFTGGLKAIYVPISMPLTVQKASPSLSLSSNPTSPQSYPISVILSSTLSSYYGTLAGQTINFYNGASLLGSGVTDENGIATYTLNNPGVSTYSFTSKYNGDTNNLNATSNSLSFAINKGAQSALSVTGVPGTVTYGDSNFVLSTTGGSGTGATTFSSSDTGVLSVNSSTGEVSIIGAGTAEITAIKSADSNYNSASTTTGTITVNKSDNSLVISCGNITYGETPSPQVTSNTSGGAVRFEYKVAAADDSTYSSFSPSNSGSYTVRATSDETANYNSAAAAVNFTIDKATLLASTNNVSIVAGDGLPTFTAHITGFKNGESESLEGFVKPTVSHSVTDTTVVGDYPLTISGGFPTANYVFSYQSGLILTIETKIDASTPSFHLNLSGEVIYSENASAAALTVSAVVADTGTVTYQWYKNTVKSTTGGVKISGATLATYTPSTDTIGTTYYYVIATNTNDSVNGTKVATKASDYKKVMVIPKIDVVETPIEIKNPELIFIEPNGEAFDESVDVRIKDDPTIKGLIKDLLDEVPRGKLENAAVYPLDISLFVKGTDIKIQPNQGTSVTITIPIPEVMLADKDNIKVVCVIDGKLTVLETKVVLIDGVYCIHFTATHFSPYAMVVDTKNVLGNTNPETGESFPFISFTLLSISALIFFEIFRRNRKLI